VFKAVKSSYVTRIEGEPMGTEFLLGRASSAIRDPEHIGRGEPVLDSVTGASFGNVKSRARQTDRHCLSPGGPDRGHCFEQMHGIQRSGRAL